MNGSNAQLLLNEFCYICHSEACSCCEWRIGGTYFVSIGARNGIAVVPIGNDHGCAGNCQANGLNALCIGDAFNAVHHTVFIGHFTHEFTWRKKKGIGRRIPREYLEQIVQDGEETWFTLDINEI